MNLTMFARSAGQLARRCASTTNNAAKSAAGFVERSITRPNGDVCTFTPTGGISVALTHHRNLGFKVDGVQSQETMFVPELSITRAQDAIVQLEREHNDPDHRGIDEHLTAKLEYLQKTFNGMNVEIILGNGGEVSFFLPNGQFKQRYDAGFETKVGIAHAAGIMPLTNVAARSLLPWQRKDVFEQLADNAYAIITRGGAELVNSDHTGPRLGM